MESITPPEGFRHQAAIQVRWGDMDALGHVSLHADEVGQPTFV